MSVPQLVNMDPGANPWSLKGDMRLNLTSGMSFYETSDLIFEYKKGYSSVYLPIWLYFRNNGYNWTFHEGWGIDSYDSGVFYRIGSGRSDLLAVDEPLGLLGSDVLSSSRTDTLRITNNDPNRKYTFFLIHDRPYGELFAAGIGRLSLGNLDLRLMNINGFKGTDWLNQNSNVSIDFEWLAPFGKVKGLGAANVSTTAPDNLLGEPSFANFFEVSELDTPFGLIGLSYLNIDQDFDAPLAMKTIKNLAEGDTRSLAVKYKGKSVIGLSREGSSRINDQSVTVGNKVTYVYENPENYYYHYDNTAEVSTLLGTFTTGLEIYDPVGLLAKDRTVTYNLGFKKKTNLIDISNLSIDSTFAVTNSQSFLEK
jgi:hypothetical protein